MKKWKYRVELICPPNWEALGKELNKWGENYWEAFKIEHRKDHIIIYLKKRIN